MMLTDVLQVRGEALGGQARVLPIPIHAEVTGVGAADARQHRDGTDQAPGQRRGAQLRHALFDGREIGGGTHARHAGGRVAAAAENIVDEGAIALLHHDVEKARRVVWKRAGMRSAEDGARTAALEQARQRVRERAGLGVRADEDHVDIGGDQRVWRRLAVIGRVEGLVTQLAAPHRHRLRHDADVLLAEVRRVDAIPAAGRGIGEQIEDADAQTPRPPMREASSRRHDSVRAMPTPELTRAIARQYDLFQASLELIAKERPFLNYGYTITGRESYEDRQQQLCLEVFRAAEIRASDVIVDVGFGTGEQDILLARTQPFASLIGFNVAERQVAFAAARVAADGLDGRISLRLGEAETMPGLDPESVDRVLAIECAFYFDRPRFYRRAAEVLRPGGRVVLADIALVGSAGVADAASRPATGRDTLGEPRRVGALFPHAVRAFHQWRDTPWRADVGVANPLGAAVDSVVCSRAPGVAQDGAVVADCGPRTRDGPPPLRPDRAREVMTHAVVAACARRCGRRDPKRWC